MSAASKFVEQIPESFSFEVILTFEKNILNDIPLLRI